MLLLVTKLEIIRLIFKKINKSRIEPISIVNGEYVHNYIVNLFSCQYKIKSSLTMYVCLIFTHVDQFMIKL